MQQGLQWCQLRPGFLRMPFLTEGGEQRTRHQFISSAVANQTGWSTFVLHLNIISVNFPHCTSEYINRSYRATCNIRYFTVPLCEYSSLAAPKDKAQMIRKGSPLFPKPSPPSQKILCSCGWLANRFFPFGSLVNPKPNSEPLMFRIWPYGALSSIYIPLHEVEALKLSLAQAVELPKGLQLLSQTHLRVISKIRVDSLKMNLITAVNSSATLTSLYTFTHPKYDA